ncbi:hypothetical protein [Bradyrhizobium betae]|uniref:Uncharacterized protein n=1 Tax=Bradyrhizobium betae TaxID=244734 RepID=A0A4Q1UME5_9BRAD|nr:hypothetical protein [Bradyrhizobium betae]RXT36541.1 hypothetical protein B5V03_33375 [Bradyrhizobium betae]
MTGLLQNLARLGRGEPIAGAARVALPPRFAGPVQIGNAPMLETWPDEGQALAPPQAAMPDSTNADDPVTEAQAPQHKPAEPDQETASLRLVTKIAAALPRQSNDAQSISLGDAAPPVASRDSQRMTNPLNVAVQDAPPSRNEAATPLAPPLGQAVLAGQAQRRRETPPVIKVTIDRIDIRSPEPPRSARTVKPAPKPSVSLSDYLRRPGPGGRA